MLLAINTSTLQFGLAVLERDGSVLAEHFESGGKGHFGRLMPALDFLFAGSQWNIRDVEGIIVAMGPGSFTGLRVGLSAAKGLSQGLEIPIIGVHSLEALACQIPCSGSPVITLLDSRKGELFAARFTWNEEHRLIRDMEDICLKVEDLASLLNGPALFIGNDYAVQGPLLRETLGPRAILTPAHLWNPKASPAGLLGLERFNAGDFDESEQLNPLYLRPPDIRPNPTFVINSKP